MSGLDIFYRWEDGISGRESDSVIVANNGAYWGNGLVEVIQDGEIIDSFVVRRVILSNLIDGGFHSHELRNR